jgi:hypothetical protein
MNGIGRKAKLTLDPTGTLKGDVTEIRVGDRAWYRDARTDRHLGREREPVPLLK